MTAVAARRQLHPDADRSIRFEDLAGRRFAIRVRESDPKQRDRYGPVTQRRITREWAARYGLVDAGIELFSVYSGTKVGLDPEVERGLDLARRGVFDVLLLLDTSRWARKETYAFALEEEFHAAGVFVVYVMESIIASNDDTADVKGVHHVMNSGYSRKLRVKVTEGLRDKFETHRDQPGTAPFGWRRAGRERLMKPMAAEAAIAVALAERYVDPLETCQGAADWANGRGWLTRAARPWSKQTVYDVLRRPLNHGEAVYHRGRPDERRVKVRGLFAPELSAKVRAKLAAPTSRRGQPIQWPSRRIEPRPPGVRRAYEFSTVVGRFNSRWACCGASVTGKGTYDYRRYHHPKPYCRQGSYAARHFTQHFADFLARFELPSDSIDRIRQAYELNGDRTPDTTMQQMALERELRSRAVDHATGKLSTEAYLAEHTRVGAEIETLRLAKDTAASAEGDLEQLVEYLTNVSRMWAHSEATHEERKAFVLEVLEEADLGENRILRIKPRADYRELFRVGAYGKSVTYGRGERTRTSDLVVPNDARYLLRHAPTEDGQS